MLRPFGKLFAMVTRYSDQTAKLAGLAPTRLRRSIFLLPAAGFALMMLPPQDAWAHYGGAHSGSFHQGGAEIGQFHRRNFNQGHLHSGPFHADHFRHHGAHERIVIIPPVSGYYPPSVYYYSPPVITQGTPMTFVEQGSDGTTLNYWYYCGNPPGYYPYVQQCPSGWQIIEAGSSY